MRHYARPLRATLTTLVMLVAMAGAAGAEGATKLIGDFPHGPVNKTDVGSLAA